MKKTTFYNISITILALISVIIAIIDIEYGLTSALAIIDFLILIIFIVDYVVRLLLSNNKKAFIKNNIFDLIAIIPFNGFFRAAKVLKITQILRFAKLLKLLKLLRLIAVFARLTKKLNSFLTTNKFNYMLLASLFIVLGGSIAIYFVEGMSFSDSIWWSFVTITTVGYGDISPSTSIGRIIACILMLFGIGLIGSLTSTITSFFFNKQKPMSTTFQEDVINQIRIKLENPEQLTTAEIDHIAETLKIFSKNKS